MNLPVNQFYRFEVPVDLRTLCLITLELKGEGYGSGITI